MASECKLVSAFSREYLEVVWERDDPSTSLEAETAEPWEVRREKTDWYALFRPWEKGEEGKAPRALFKYEETAWLFRLIWPALGRDRIFRLGATRAAEGYPVQMGDDTTVAYLRGFDPDAVFAAHLASYLIRTPYALAYLVWLAGPTVQQEVGRLLADLASGPREAGPDRE